MADTNPNTAAQATSGPFWLGWQLTNNNRDTWEQWLRDYVINPVNPEELHFTMLYSKDNTKPWPQPMRAAWTGKLTGVGLLGKALVAVFDAPQFIHARFAQLSQDHPHSFPTLIPHMTLTYDGAPYANQLDAVYNSLNQAKLQLGFTNEAVQTPKDPTDLAAYMDTMSAICQDVSPAQSESQFIQTFLAACAARPDVAAAYTSGNVEIYKHNLMQILTEIEAARPHRDS